jgi:hypothetical protein
MNFTQCVMSVLKGLMDDQTAAGLLIGLILMNLINQSTLVVYFHRKFISHAGVEAVGILDSGGNGGFYPAAMAAITGIVGEPDTVDGPDNIGIDFGVHFVRAEQGPDTACIGV